MTGSGQKLWKHARERIAGGNMLLSKRPEMFLPEGWPAYFSRAKGVCVWDLDGREYVEMSVMSVGTNTLGYGHDVVDDAVRSVIDKGNMSSLNAPEEVELADRLVELHPWADMVRFARTGGEANAVGIRIGRAASGKDGVAICGYHGWHDWYLATNLGEGDALDGHLLPGLDPTGVPKGLAGTVFPFAYNDLEALTEIVATQSIGVIKIEVVRNAQPAPGFLEGVRALADQNGIVLIFDECTSGFRQSFGGIHKLYDVTPDMAIFGKALGNGYAVTAAIGTADVMQAAQSSFISSTFWTERIGSVAGLATLGVMAREKSWETITDTGARITKRWQEMAAHHGLPLKTSGIPALTSFGFDSPNALGYKTLITQEMLKKGYLAANSVYVSIAHTPDIIDGYFEALDPVFALIADCENDGRKLDDLLEGPVCHSGFSRLN